MNSYQFYLRKNVLQIRVNDHGSKIRKSLKIPIEEKNWDHKRQKAKGNSVEARNINDKIDQIKMALRTYRYLHEVEAYLNRITGKSSSLGSDVLYLTTAFKDFVEGCKVGVIKSNAGRKMAHNTLISLEKACLDYEDYTNLAGDIDCYEVDLYSVKARERAAVIKRVKGHFQGYIDHLISLDRKPSTQQLKLQKIVRVLKHLEDEFGIKVPDKMPVIKPISEVLLPPMEFADFIVSRGFKGKKQLEKDSELVILLQFFTCSRIGDIVSLKEENFIESNGKVYIEKVDEKTMARSGAPIPVPVYEMCKENIKENGTPFSNKFKYKTHRSKIVTVNSWITQALKETEIGKKRISAIEQHPDGTIERVSKPYYEVITSHIIRKFGMNYYEKRGKVTRENIKSMSGHSKNSTVFESDYMGVIDTIKNAEISGAQEELVRKLIDNLH